MNPVRIKQTFLTINFGWMFLMAFYNNTMLYSLSKTPQGLSLAIWAFILHHLSDAVGEISTGHFADRYGHRRSILLGLFVMAFGGGTLFFVAFTAASLSYVSSLALVALGEITFLLGNGFVSGALEAWAVESLKQAQDGDVNLESLFASQNIIFNVAFLVGGTAALITILLIEQYWVCWAILAWGFLLTGGYATYTVHKLVLPQRRKIGFGKQMRELFNSSIGVLKIREILLANGLHYVLTMTLSLFWVKIFVDLISDAKLAAERVAIYVCAGWILFSILRVAAAYLAKLIIHRFPENTNRALVVTSLVIPVPILVFSFRYLNQPSSLLVTGVTFLLAFFLTRATEIVAVPIRMARLNEAIKDSHHRAACISMLNAIGGILIVLLFFVYRLLFGSFPTNTYEMMRFVCFSGVIALAAPYLYAKALK